MATAKDIVSMAVSQLGVKEVPANSNKVKYNTEYYGKAVSGSSYPWCAVFVWWVFKHAGASDLYYGGKKSAYCPDLVNYYKKTGQWLDRSAKPQAGDIILFANKGVACHVGIVEKRINSSSVQTIEGNTSAGNNANGGQVQRRTRTYGSVGSSWYILGFARPKYDGGKSDSSTSTTKPSQDKDNGNTTVSYPKNPKTIKEVQKYMNGKHNAGLAVDGIFGANTKKAIVKRVQNQLGVTMDGIFGAKSKAKWTNDLVKSGSKNALSKLVQMMLLCKGYNIGTTGADGEIGTATLSAMSKFQSKNDLKQKKYVTKNMAEKLFG